MTDEEIEQFKDEIKQVNTDFSEAIIKLENLLYIFNNLESVVNNILEKFNDLTNISSHNKIIGLLKKDDGVVRTNSCDYTDIPVTDWLK